MEKWLESIKISSLYDRLSSRPADQQTSNILVDNTIQETIINTIQQDSEKPVQIINEEPSKIITLPNRYQDDIISIDRRHDHRNTPSFQSTDTNDIKIAMDRFKQDDKKIIILKPSIEQVEQQATQQITQQVEQQVDKQSTQLADKQAIKLADKQSIKLADKQAINLANKQVIKQVDTINIIDDVKYVDNKEIVEYSLTTISKEHDFDHIISSIPTSLCLPKMNDKSYILESTIVLRCVILKHIHTYLLENLKYQACKSCSLVGSSRFKRESLETLFESPFMITVESYLWNPLLSIIVYNIADNKINNIDQIEDKKEGFYYINGISTMQTIKELDIIKHMFSSKIQSKIVNILNPIYSRPKARKLNDTSAY
jgi:hypothetical protein